MHHDSAIVAELQYWLVAVDDFHFVAIEPPPLPILGGLACPAGSGKEPRLVMPKKGCAVEDAAVEGQQGVGDN